MMPSERRRTTTLIQSVSRTQKVLRPYHTISMEHSLHDFVRSQGVSVDLPVLGRDFEDEKSNGEPK